MKKITTLIIACVISMSLTSCQEQSLQSYLVESQEKSGFMTFDVPASIFQIQSDALSEASSNSLKTIKKINVVMLRANGTNVDAVASEKAQLDKIFKNTSYKSLMRFTEKNMKVNLFYTGSKDAINEIIIYGYGDDIGVGISRVLGENMNISDIMKIAEEAKLDVSNLQLEQLSAMFSAK